MKRNNKYYKVVYLGIPGSYSYIAVVNYFKNEISMIGVDSIKLVFQKVVAGDCEFGIVPLENSTSGSIVETYDLLLGTGLSIVGEAILHIHHHLLGNRKVKHADKDLRRIRRCYSHPQAISQCAAFFNTHWWIKPVFTSDTASAAQLVAKNNKMSEVAIAGQEAARIYDLLVIRKNIETSSNNFTRFAAISKKRNKTGNKISLAFSVKHVPGSLFRALAPYAKKGLNLTKIESRPVMDRPWEYIFFLDFAINGKEKEAHEVIVEMKGVTNFLTPLGRYQKGQIYET